MQFLNHLLVQLLVNNQLSMCLSKNTKFHSQIKQIDCQGLGLETINTMNCSYDRV